MPRRGRELLYALAAALAVTAVYLLAYRLTGSVPPASSPLGHWTGVIGIALMLFTEVAYSVRKRLQVAAWGSLAAWLRAHVFTGLVGPYMVLLHTAGHFGGLAGVTMLMTAVVVASGVVGRYIYTRAPHDVHAAAATTAGADPPAEGDRPSARRALAIWYSAHVPLTLALFALALAHSAGALFYATLQR